MRTSLPSVQFNCKHARALISRTRRDTMKRLANRRHRRGLEQIRHRLERDPEAFDGETFDVKSLSGWDIA
jgi:hypothetical protein